MITVKTTPYADGVIGQEVYDEIDGIRQYIMRRIINTQEQQVRDALIALGWTPPQTSGEQRADS